MLRFIGFFLASILIIAILGIAGVFVGLYYFGSDLPDYKQLKDYELPVVSRAYAGNGELIKEYAIENRVFVPLNLMPKKVIQAFIAAEDKNFFIHPGIDPFGMGRAFMSNILNAGRKRPQGASTISQQVARNFFLSNEVSMARKVKEMILTFRIEEALTKERILELYLNKIYLGLGAYGVSNAALFYFNKNLEDLSVAEAAYLAILPKAPNNYHPLRKKEAAYGRRAWVLSRMAEAGFITNEQANASKREPLTVYLSGPREKAITQNSYDYYTEEVRRQINTLYGNDGLYKGGLYIRTPMDATLQHHADLGLKKGLMLYDRRRGTWCGAFENVSIEGANWQSALKKARVFEGLYPTWKQAIVINLKGNDAEIGLTDGTTATLSLRDVAWRKRKVVTKKGATEAAIGKLGDILKNGDIIAVEAETKNDKPTGRLLLQQIPEVSGGLCVVDPNTGRVLALSGGFSYDYSEFNRATQAMRQTGSSIKPLVYTTALQNGFTPSTMIVDGPITVRLGEGLPPWTPRNYTGKFLGPVTLRRALEKSLNTATVRIAVKVGMEKICQNGEKWGMYDHMARRFSNVLGAQETTVLRLTTAYAQLVNGGKKIKPHSVDRIQDRYGKTLYKADHETCANCSFDSWNDSEMPILPDARDQVIDSASAYQMVSIMQGVVERGTAVRLKHHNRPMAGKTGTANEFMSAWFVGFIPDLAYGCYIGFDNPKSLGEGEAGSRSAMPIVDEFLKLALPAIPVKPFRVSPDVELIRVNGESGKPSGDSTILEAFKPGTVPDEYASDTILDDPNSEMTSEGTLPNGGENANVSPFSLNGIY